MKTAAKSDLLQGTLDLLVLKALSVGPLHGWAISRRIRDMSREVLTVNQGSLYPALYRMERKRWIEAEWGVSETGREVKFYRLTSQGRARLKVELAQWTHFATAVSKVLDGTR